MINNLNKIYKLIFDEMTKSLKNGNSNSNKTLELFEKYKIPKTDDNMKSYTLFVMSNLNNIVSS